MSSPEEISGTEEKTATIPPADAGTQEPWTENLAPVADKVKADAKIAELSEEVKVVTEAWHAAEDDLEKLVDAHRAAGEENATLRASVEDLKSKLESKAALEAPGPWGYAKRQGASDEEAARYVLEQVAEEKADAEAARPKRYYSIGMLRDGDVPIQPGSDVTTVFSPADLKRFLEAGAVELR